MAGEINQNPVTTVTIDSAAYFDLDNWTGAAFESQRVPISVMHDQIARNIMNANLVQGADRNHDSNGKTQSFTNGKQFSMTSAFAPASLGSFEFGGFGTTLSDQLLNIKNGSGTVNTTFYGNSGVRHFGHMGINVTPSSVTQQFIFGDNSSYGLLVQGASTTASIGVDGVSGNSTNLFLGLKLNGGKTGIRIQDNVIAATAERPAYVADITGSNTADNIGALLDVQNPGAGEALAIEVLNGLIVSVNMPTSSAGLPTGTIWNNSGVLNIT